MTVDITYKEQPIQPIRSIRVGCSMANSDYLSIITTGDGDIRINLKDNSGQDLVFIKDEDAVELGKALIKLGEQA